MKTLEAYLKENFEKCKCEHAVTVTHAEDGEVKFFIYPLGTDKEFLDFSAKGNLLITAQSDDSHLEPACKSGREEKRRVNQCQEAIESLLEGHTISECQSILAAASFNLQMAAMVQKFIPDQIEGRNWAHQTRPQLVETVRRVPSNPENEQFRAVAN